MIGDDCIAGSLARQGVRDSFRERHPELQAVTFTSLYCSAARLNQIWVRSAIGHILQVLNAAILWAWPWRRDHDSVVCDILVELPTAAPLEEPSCGQRWRDLVALTGSDAASASARSQVDKGLSPFREGIGAAVVSLQNACTISGRLADGSLPESGTCSQAGNLAPWQVECEPCAGTLRRLIEDAHDAIEVRIASCLPLPRSQNDCRAVRQATGAWDEYVSLFVFCAGSQGALSACSNFSSCVHCSDWRSHGVVDSSCLVGLRGQRSPAASSQTICDLR